MRKVLFLLALVGLSSTTVAASIDADSTAGKRLLSRAVGRQLENNQYYSFMTKYSLKFAGCHSVPQFERDQGMRSQLLAKFKLCPSDNCNKCPHSGEYIVEMKCVFWGVCSLAGRIDWTLVCFPHP